MLGAMRKHRRKLLVGLAAATLGVAIYSHWPQPDSPGSRITPYTVLRIRVGMTRERVEALFGAPSGD
jgi:outer membrane protein assembly factor BamE (lipoprotein component of BamABCDE complex)